MAALNAPERLRSIGLHVSDTEKDSVLDDLVREAARVAGTPIALVSVVMSRIQYFRAAYGLPEDLALSRATSRCTSFCQFVVQEEGPFLVTQATSDARVPTDLVDRYGIEAYAGVPVRQQGEVIGSLCVIDTKPRDLPAALVKELEGIAARVEQRLDMLRERTEAREAEAILATTLLLWLHSSLRKMAALEGQLTELSARMADATGSDEAAAKGAAERLSGLYREVEDEVRSLRIMALRIADAVKLRGKLVDGETLEAFRRDALALDREARELAPIARLSQGLDVGSIATEVFQRNASVLDEALLACRDMRATLARLKEVGGRIGERLEQEG
jgi:hypothetical protein